MLRRILKEVVCVGVNWIHLAPLAIMNLGVAYFVLIEN
jgi:hypothetical protein